jgi:hypothetical protein
LIDYTTPRETTGGVFIYHTLKGGVSLSASHWAVFSFHNEGGLKLADDKKNIGPEVETPTETPAPG